MSIDVTSQAYQEGRERLYEHVKEQHQQPLADLYRSPDAQEKYAREIREGYDKSITEAYKAGNALYADPNYAAGAKAGVRDWERDVKEAERETVKIKVA